MVPVCTAYEISVLNYIKYCIEKCRFELMFLDGTVLTENVCVVVPLN